LRAATPTSGEITLRNISGTPCIGVRSGQCLLDAAQDRKDMALRSSSWTAACAAALAAACLSTGPTRADEPARNDYPTYARVQYVQDCAARAGGSQADLYKCACVIDKLAEHLTYDEFVEASTFAHYSTLPGEAGGIFRDPPEAKSESKRYRTLEADAYRACGLKPASTGR